MTEMISALLAMFGLLFMALVALIGMSYVLMKELYDEKVSKKKGDDF